MAKQDSVQPDLSDLPMIAPEDSQFLGKLVRCNFRGACRRLPDAEIATLKRLSEQLGLRKRLCACRQPDFLLELISAQGNNRAPLRTYGDNVTVSY